MAPGTYPKFSARENVSCHNCLEKTSRRVRCSGCHVTIYCGKECQKADWKNHKPRCHKMDTALNPVLNKVDPATGKTELETRKDMDKWYMNHQTDFSVALRQILQLDLYPERVDTHALEVRVAYNPSPSSTAQLFIFDSMKVYTNLEPDDFTIPRLRHPDRPDLREGVDISDVKPDDELAALFLTYKYNQDCGVVHSTLISQAHFPRLSAANWVDFLPLILDGRINGRLAADSFYFAMSEYVHRYQEHIIDSDKYVSVDVQMVGLYVCSLKSVSDPSFKRDIVINCQVKADQTYDIKFSLLASATETTIGCDF